MERQLEENIHHTYFARHAWNNYRLTNQIRNHEQSKVLLPVGIHNELHANTSSMPIPSAFVARLGLERILNRSYTTTLDTVLDSEEYLRSIGQQYHNDALEIADRLAEQIPFIQLGVKSLKERHV